MKQKNNKHKPLASAIIIIVIVVLFFIVLFLTLTFHAKNSSFAVLNALHGKNYKKAEKYETVVIDPDNFSSEELQELKSSGTLCYAYINVGSLETFRDYYDDFKTLEKKKYDGFDDEFWVDVTDASWQQHISDLCDECINAGYDGFFLDNIDVYDELGEDEETFTSLSNILLIVKSTGFPVIINGGKDFVKAYIKSGSPAYLICDGICQESVYSSYDADTKKYGRNDATSTKEYLKYLDARKKDGLEIYLIEYTKNPLIKCEAMFKAVNSKWNIYVADSIELK